MSEDATVQLLEQSTYNQEFVNVMVLSHSRVGSYFFDCLALKIKPIFAKSLHLQRGYIELIC